MQGLTNRMRGLLPTPHPQTAAQVHVPSTLDKSEKKDLSNFSKAWKKALHEPNDARALQAFWTALETMDVSFNHLEVEAEVAEFFRAGCRRWAHGDGAGDFAIQLFKSIRGSRVDLSSLDPERISFLSDLISEQMLSPIPEIAHQYWNGPERGPMAIGFVPALYAVLPREAQMRLEADIANFVLRASSGGREIWATDVGKQSIEALRWISDPHLQTTVAVGLLETIALRNESFGSPDEWAVDWAFRTVVTQAPQMTQPQLANLTGRMAAVIDHTMQVGDRSLLPFLLRACLATLRLCDNFRTFAPVLLPALLHRVYDTLPESVEVLAGAVALAEPGDVKVGIALHRYIASLNEHHLQALRPGDQISLAVMSFHVDPGVHPYYLAEEHDLAPPLPTDRTVVIPYPDWLITMRGMLSEIWTVQPHPEYAEQRALVETSLAAAQPGSTSPNAADEFAPGSSVQHLMGDFVTWAVGPRVGIADWPYLQAELDARLRS